MNDFTASNGLRIMADAHDRLEIGGDLSNVLIHPDVSRALREFFRAEEDERLGRWRWLHEPRFVVYPWHNVDDPNPRIAIVDEGTGGQFTTTRATASGTDTWAKVARAYFDAHPEPKPWHEAKPGEIWAVEGVPRAVVARAHGEPATFADPFGLNPGFPVTSPEIRTATRIWEVSS